MHEVLSESDWTTSCFGLMLVNFLPPKSWCYFTRVDQIFFDSAFFLQELLYMSLQLHSQAVDILF